MTPSGAFARFLLAGLLCLLAVPRASAVKTERLHRFAAAPRPPSPVEVLSGPPLVPFKAGVPPAPAAAPPGPAARLRRHARAVAQLARRRRSALLR